MKSHSNPVGIAVARARTHARSVCFHACVGSMCDNRRRNYKLPHGESIANNDLRQLKRDLMHREQKGKGKEKGQRGDDKQQDTQHFVYTGLTKKKSKDKRKHKKEEEEEKRREEEFDRLYKPACCMNELLKKKIKVDDDDDDDDEPRRRLDTGAVCPLSRGTVYAASAVQEYCEVTVDEYRSDSELRDCINMRLLLHEPCSECLMCARVCEITCLRRFDERPILRDALQMIYCEAVFSFQKRSVPGTGIAGKVYDQSVKCPVTFDIMNRRPATESVPPPPPPPLSNESCLNENAKKELDNRLCLEAMRVVGELSASCDDRELFFLSTRAGDIRRAIGVVTPGMQWLMRHVLEGTVIWSTPRLVNMRSEHTDESVSAWLDGSVGMEYMYPDEDYFPEEEEAGVNKSKIR